MELSITTIDTNGTKSRALNRAEFGYDDHTDVGRVWIGTTAGIDIALAKLTEVEAVQDIINDASLTRADKYLASQNVVNMEYNAEGKLVKVQYNNLIDDDYEVLSYNAECKLSNVAHYVATVLKGNTVLSYSNGKLVSAPYTAI